MIKWDVIVALWVVVPLVLVAASSATVYDSWWHLYFIYPGIVFFAVGGLEFLASRYKAD